MIEAIDGPNHHRALRAQRHLVCRPPTEIVGHPLDRLMHREGVLLLLIAIVVVRALVLPLLVAMTGATWTIVDLSHRRFVREGLRLASHRHEEAWDPTLMRRLDFLLPNLDCLPPNLDYLPPDLDFHLPTIVIVTEEIATPFLEAPHQLAVACRQEWAGGELLLPLAPHDRYLSSTTAFRISSRFLLPSGMTAIIETAGSLRVGMLLRRSETTGDLLLLFRRVIAMGHLRCNAQTRASRCVQTFAR